MACKNDVSSATHKIDAKTGAKVITYKTTRKCSPNPKAIEEDSEETEEEEQENISLMDEDTNSDKDIEIEEEGITMSQIKESFQRFLK